MIMVIMLITKTKKNHFSVRIKAIGFKIGIKKIIEKEKDIKIGN